MRPNPAIRSARQADLPAIRDLLDRAELPLEGLEDQFGEAYAVAIADGKVIGTIGIERYANFGLLRSAVVDEEWRGMGLGELLTRERLAWAQAVGVNSVYLLTTTAAPFFERLGFRRVARERVPEAVKNSPEYSGICPSTATIMSLDFPVVDRAVEAEFGHLR